jgi:hypothetical protein
MFVMSDNYRTMYLRFKVAWFKCAYNTIMGRPRLAKFTVVPHYSYMMLKMSGPQGIITVKADFHASMECYRGAIQTALASSTSVAQKHMIIEANMLPQDDLPIPATEATLTPVMRPTEETKKANHGLLDARKTAIISSSLTPK